MLRTLTHVSCMLVACLAGAYAAAAGGTSPNYVAPGFTAPAAGSLLLLLHVPAAEPAYRSGDRSILDVVQRSLQERGYKVGVLDHADYKFAVDSELAALAKLALAPTAQQLAIAEASALALVARVACRELKSPMLVRTRVVTRSTELWQSFARWDGVSRQIKFTGGEGKPEEVLANVQGSGPGVSIEMVAITPDGQLVVKYFGGVSLPYYAAGRLAIPQPVADPFAVHSDVAEGARIALSPLVGQ